MKRDLAIEPQLVPGERGVFDVAVDGTVIFSKHAEGRFPSEAEIVAAIRSRTK